MLALGACASPVPAVLARAGRLGDCLVLVQVPDPAVLALAGPDTPIAGRELSGIHALMASGGVGRFRVGLWLTRAGFCFRAAWCCPARNARPHARPTRKQNENDAAEAHRAVQLGRATNCGESALSYVPAKCCYKSTTGSRRRAATGGRGYDMRIVAPHVAHLATV